VNVPAIRTSPSGVASTLRPLNTVRPEPSRSAVPLMFGVTDLEGSVALVNVPVRPGLVNRVRPPGRLISPPLPLNVSVTGNAQNPSTVNGPGSTGCGIALASPL
jgi:hypothetical protein